MEVVGRMNESSNIETEDVYTAHNHKKFNSFCIADILQLESRETSPREKLIVRPWDDCRKSPFHVRGGGDFLPSSADCPPADPVDCQRNPLTSLYLMMINSNHPRRTQTTQLERELHPSSWIITVFNLWGLLERKIFQLPTVLSMFSTTHLAPRTSSHFPDRRMSKHLHYSTKELATPGGESVIKGPWTKSKIATNHSQEILEIFQLESLIKLLDGW